jgi:hypothetical protein
MGLFDRSGKTALHCRNDSAAVTEALILVTGSHFRYNLPLLPSCRMRDQPLRTWHAPKP